MAGTYSLDQKSSQQSELNTSGRVQTANDASGYRNTVINNFSGGDLDNSQESTGGEIGQSMSEMPVWAYVVAGLVAVVALFLVLKRKKK